MASDDYKLQAAEQALEYVSSGMKLGLGTGSTAARFVDLLGKRVAAGLDVICVPTSEVTRIQAERLGIRLTTLDAEPFLDLTIDGADEIDAELALIKGGGGALLREKIVATASDSMVVIADSSKLVARLGAFPLPIEVIPFGLKSTQNLIEMLAQDAGCHGAITLRTGTDGRPFVTDSGNHILDCAFGSIPDAESLDEALKLIPGVVDNGLFIGIADIAVVAGPDGIQIIESHALADEA